MEAAKLARLSFSADGGMDERVTTLVLENLTRSELKEYLAALKRELRRRRVDVSVSGAEDRPLRDTLGVAYPGKEMVVSRDDALGGGVRIRAGDDVIDASVKGYFSSIIGKLREK